MAAMGKEEQTASPRGMLPKRIVTAILVLMGAHGAANLLLPAWKPAWVGTCGSLWLADAYAQAVNPQAVSKYEAGVAAMKKGDCAAARTLLKQAVAMDAQDRSVRVGMFLTEYYPSARLKEVEAKCPAPPPPPPAAKAESPPPPAVAPPLPPPPPAETPEKPAVAKVAEKSPTPPPAKPEGKPQEPEKPKPEAIAHKVFAGETWESIAKWYVGDAGKAKELASRNPGLSSPLKAGELVKVPQELATVHKKQGARSTAEAEPKPIAKTQAAPPAVVPAAPPPPPRKIEGLQGVFGPK